MMSTSKYPFPLDLNEDHHYHQPFSTQPSSSSSSSSLSCPSFFSSPQEQGGYCHDDPLQFQYQEEANKVLVPHGGSCDRASLTNENTDDYSGLKLSIWKKEDRNENQSESGTASAKWISSKMRLMRKMMNPNSSVQKFEDPKQPSKSLEADPTSCNNSNENCNNTIRVCSDCNTTKTPLWRSGPSGPKSLCNACGIRQRKARRAMAAAAAEAANGTVLAADAPPTKNKVQQKEKRSSNECVPQFKKKKKRKHTSPSRGRKNLCFEDLTIILSKSSAFQRVFPQDEKDAAILLMALSYGLVHG